MSAGPVCPFCSRYPFHYIDNGLGMEAVAVTCCDLGNEYFRGARPAPEEVTLSWEEFCEIGQRLLSTSTALREMREALEKTTSELRDLRAMVHGECPSLLEDHFSAPNIDAAIEAGEAAIEKATIAGDAS